jgi:hypothetical protein
MRKIINPVLPALAVLFFAASFSSCVKDTCRRSYSYKIYEPFYKTVAEVRANIKSNTPREVENPGKLYIRGNYIFLNEIDKGIHVINNSNPASPQRVAFIDIPGNVDLAVKGDILYADLYTDLVALDISNPMNVTVKKIVDGVFPHRLYGNGFVPVTDKIITRWDVRDTTVTVDCELGDSVLRQGVLFLSSADGAQIKANSSSPVGIGGSMARFAVVNNYLYTVGDAELSAFNITNAAGPALVKKNQLEWGIETIYPFKNRLFIGSNSGMFIYDISNPSSPVQLGQFSHVRSCDPVIADDNTAYVTLRSGNVCRGFTNQMEVLDINNPLAPLLIKTYPMTNPHGLSKDGNLLFVCDGVDGLKIYDAASAGNILLKKTIAMSETYDVIAFNKTAIVVAKDGLYQYDYTDAGNIKLLSKIGLKQ